jgi:hypothetical protein
MHKRSHIRSHLGLAALSLLFGIAGYVVANAAPTSATTSCGNSGSFDSSTNTCTYAATGTDSYTVPSGVSQVTFDVLGAQGGAGGGLGGEAKAVVDVTPGEVFQVSVGAGGGTSSCGYYCAGQTSEIHGGGASDVRSGSCANTAACGLADRVIVAGGGGGSSSCSPLAWDEHRWRWRR